MISHRTCARIRAAALAAVIAACSPPLLGAPLQQAAAAAEKAAEQAPQCAAVAPFYWEIGDADGVLASGSVGTEYTADSEMKIASASKWVWGAYVLEKTRGALSDAQRAMLQMRSGFRAFNPLRCLLSRSVQGCMERAGGAERDPAAVGRFAYSGGHSQRLALDLGLGALGADALTSEVLSVLGGGLDFRYARAQLAGGMESTPAAYGEFLRRILSGRLRMREFLGRDAVCTLPRACPGALYSPVPEAWHYSLNHWVEDDPRTGDGAFSSPGLTGFYPWISADKRFYGILARSELSERASWNSVLCGREIRKAWIAAAVPE